MEIKILDSDETQEGEDYISEASPTWKLQHDIWDQKTSKSISQIDLPKKLITKSCNLNVLGYGLFSNIKMGGHHPTLLTACQLQQIWEYECLPRWGAK